ncbi:MAG TPA: hypothetical protein VG815_04455 [Chloroflexota bacterium]|nr:hypothetical protein [Chloroflexota bacterium]
MERVLGNPTRTCVVVARLGYEFVTDLPDVHQAILDHFSDSLSDRRDDAALTTTISRGEIGFDPDAGAVTVSASGSVVTATANDAFTATIDLSRRSGELVVGVDHLRIGVENYLRIANAIMVLERGGVQLHSAGVIRDGYGFTFFGPADSGKTTSAGFSVDHHILSDDQNVLLPVDGGVTLCGVPFRSVACPPSAAPGQAPLLRLLRLIQDQTNYLEPVGRVSGIAMLASQCSFVNHLPDFTDQLLANCEEIVKRVPVEALHFTRSADFWKII